MYIELSKLMFAFDPVLVLANRHYQDFLVIRVVYDLPKKLLESFRSSFGGEKKRHNLKLERMWTLIGFFPLSVNDEMHYPPQIMAHDKNDPLIMAHDQKRSIGHGS